MKPKKIIGYQINYQNDTEKKKKIKTLIPSRNKNREFIRRKE